MTKFKPGDKVWVPCVVTDAKPYEHLGKTYCDLWVGLDTGNGAYTDVDDWIDQGVLRRRK